MTGAERPDVHGPGQRIVLRNEFAVVEVRLDETASGPRLLVRDLESGRAIHLDALEAESLTRMDHADFADLVRPE
ncbi:dihydrodiol dehydrogenase [Streptomyces sp. NPDC050560]|uniref:dihydrodiol dehydrogenase n=1 Tax=Streptomyces sp. NPDC050560 TaxID=3365630 RepID=UPI0037A13311